MGSTLVLTVFLVVVATIVEITFLVMVATMVAIAPKNFRKIHGCNFGCGRNYGYGCINDCGYNHGCWWYTWLRLVTLIL